MIVELEHLLGWAQSLPEDYPHALQQLALAHERLLAFLCTCYLAPGFIEEVDRLFVKEHLTTELRAFAKDVNGSTRDPSLWGVTDMLSFFYDSPHSGPAREEWRHRLDVDGGRQADPNIPPIEATVPDLEDGLLTRGTIVFLPAILTELWRTKNKPLREPTITLGLAQAMISIIDLQMGNQDMYTENELVYTYLRKPWHALERFVRRSVANATQARTKGTPDTLSAASYANMKE